VTVNPSADGSSGGVCWGVGYKEAFAQGRDASDVREALAPLMPELGEDRRIVSDIFDHVRDQCIEFVAGRDAQRILLDGEPVRPMISGRRANSLSICSSDEAVKTFIAHCDVAARDLLIGGNSVKDHRRAKFYADVWAAMYKMQDELEGVTNPLFRPLKGKSHLFKGE
jgi:hypothetical protein